MLCMICSLGHGRTLSSMKRIPNLTLTEAASSFPNLSVCIWQGTGKEDPRRVSDLTAGASGACPEECKEQPTAGTDDRKSLQERPKLDIRLCSFEAIHYVEMPRQGPGKMGMGLSYQTRRQHLTGMRWV